jgi:hypothetical protein
VLFQREAPRAFICIPEDGDFATKVPMVLRKRILNIIHNITIASHHWYEFVDLLSSENELFELATWAESSFVGRQRVN